MTSSPGTARPGAAVDYALAVPESWHRIRLAPERRTHDIDRLLAIQFRGQDDMPHLKRVARAGLEEQAEEGWQIGGIELYISHTTMGPVPLAASLLVSAIGPHPDGRLSPEDVVESLDLDGADARLVDLPAGRAVRVRTRQAPQHVGDAQTPPSAGLDVHVPVPGTDGYLLLAFATPMPPPLDEAMIELFDAVAASIRWVAA